MLKYVDFDEAIGTPLESRTDLIIGDVGGVYKINRQGYYHERDIDLSCLTLGTLEMSNSIFYGNFEAIGTTIKGYAEFFESLFFKNFVLRDSRIQGDLGCNFVSADYIDFRNLVVGGDLNFVGDGRLGTLDMRGMEISGKITIDEIPFKEILR